MTTTTDHPVSPDGPRRPQLLVFDVNETLSDMSPMAGRFEDLGLPGLAAKTWFASVLRDGFALAAAGSNAAFADIAADSLRVVLPGMAPEGGLGRELEDAVQHVMQGFAELDVHPDVVPGLRELAGLGIRLVTLSNGSASVAQRLLEGAGAADAFERLLSVEEAGRWKPAPESYAYALAECGVETQDAMLVAVHPWDIDGAARAGLATAWVNRAGTAYPDFFTAPDVEAGSLTELAGKLR